MRTGEFLYLVRSQLHLALTNFIQILQYEGSVCAVMLPMQMY